MARFAVFKVQRERALNTTVSVAYETVPGTATPEGADYTPTAGTLVFLPNETEKEVRVPIRSTNESNPESFSLRLFNPVRITLVGDTATATIPAGASGLESIFLNRNLGVLFYPGEKHPTAPGEVSDWEWPAAAGPATMDDPDGNPSDTPFPGYVGQFVLNAGPGFQVRAGEGPILMESGYYLHYLAASNTIQLLFTDAFIVPADQQLLPENVAAFNAWWLARGDCEAHFIGADDSVLLALSLQPANIGGSNVRVAADTNFPWDSEDLGYVAKIKIVPLS